MIFYPFTLILFSIQSLLRGIVLFDHIINVIKKTYWYMQTIEWKAHAPHLLRGVSRVTGHQHRLLWHRLKGLGAPSIIGRCAHQTHLWFDINNYFFCFLSLLMNSM
jgi:hypothetical protein